MRDLQDVHAYLVAQGLCDPALVAAKVHSAGGLVLGATMNDHPTMFKSVVASAPFVDLLGVMMDETLPHTVGEYGEVSRMQPSPLVLLSVLDSWTRFDPNQ